MARGHHPHLEAADGDAPALQVVPLLRLHFPPSFSAGRLQRLLDDELLAPVPRRDYPRRYRWRHFPAVFGRDRSSAGTVQAARSYLSCRALAAAHLVKQLVARSEPGRATPSPTMLRGCAVQVSGPGGPKLSVATQDDLHCHSHSMPHGCGAASATWPAVPAGPWSLAQDCQEAPAHRCGLVWKGQPAEAGPLDCLQQPHWDLE